MHSDTVSLVARQIVPHLLEMEPEDDRQKQALAHLRDWDCSLGAESVAAAIYQVWSVHLAEAILLPRLGKQLYEHYYSRREWTVAFQYQVLPDLLAFPTAMWFGEDGRAARDRVARESLGKALDELQARCGEEMDAWTWGSIHRIRFVGQLGMIPDLTELFTAGEAPWVGDEMTVCQGLFEPGSGTYDVVTVPSWRQILDPSDWDASVGTHTVGQSGNPESPHFNDLFELWSTGEYHPLPFSRQAVEAAAEGSLRLTP
jgi:penicillin amidase